jgi:hypothetical protein
MTAEFVARKNKNEQAIRVSPNRLLVEDLTAFGYPRPAPLLAAGDHVFFDDTTARPANRSAAINLFSCAHIPCISSSFRDAPPLGRRPGIHSHDGGYGFRARASKSAAADLDNHNAELG